ncbi:MAG: hypothetical protein M1829_003150 [Trizodia sp. TS-e1964]|nr:MAG: hypothetical protein M1829_003150 [Trizodia sp. TS-e1964]
MRYPISLLSALLSLLPLLLSSASPTPPHNAEITLTARAPKSAAKHTNNKVICSDNCYLTLHDTHHEGKPRGICVDGGGHYTTKREQCAKVRIEQTAKGAISISWQNHVETNKFRLYYYVNKAGELDAGFINSISATSKYLARGTLSSNIVAMQSSANYRLLKGDAQGEKHIIKPISGGDYVMTVVKDLNDYEWKDGDDIPEEASDKSAL